MPDDKDARSNLNPSGDAEITLLRPENDVEDPEVSIVIPALNEALTIGTFIDWCLSGLRDAGVNGEILIVDSSTDDTAEIAISKGARVLKTPKRGLGRAYIDAVPFVRGRYLIFGDCDCTYDFRELEPFVQKFREGYEFIMGSRFKGFIEKGAMPPLHQYFGTPVTTWILNLMYSSRFSDIHCGMRGITRDAFRRMELQSQSWEYASEMVLKSVHMELRTTEVPIRFLKDFEGRLSHHKREGWFSPWKAAWINLRAMFVYGADFFLMKPGVILLLIGLALLLPMAGGPLTIGTITLSLHWMLLGLGVGVLGLNAVFLGILVRVFFDFNEDETSRWLRRFSYTRTSVFSGLFVFLGLALCIPLACTYIQNEFSLPPELTVVNYRAVLGIFSAMTGFILFTFMLVLHAAHTVIHRPPAKEETGTGS